MKVQLSQKAPWNFRLGNPYRTRWTEVNGRFFKVSADHLNAIWEIEEVDYNGNALVLRRPQKGEDLTDPKNYEFGWSDYALTLAQAREKIAEEAS